MRELLDIAFPSNSFLICPSDELKKRGEELISLTELGQRLEYYNKHICSLCYTYPQEGLFNYGMYEHGHSHGVRFFRKEGRGVNADFEILLQERQKEIDRLKELIYRQETYFEKLKCFIEEKAGQIRFDELKIESNEYFTFIADGAGVVPKHLENYQAEIDLHPCNPEEIKDYNKYVREYVEQLMYGTEKRHWLAEENYRGFLALPAMGAIRKQVERAFDKEATVKSELDRIELKYKYYSLANYIEFLYPYSIDDLAIWQAALFNVFVKGYPYDYGKKMLKVHEIKALIHVKQVFIYYRYVHLLRKTTVYGSFKELFQHSVENGILSELKNPNTLFINEALYSYLFNGWLQNRRGWEYGDECGYQMHLIKKEFEEFLKEYKLEEQTRIFLVGNTREEATQTYHKNFQTIREWFRIKRQATKEDCKQMPGLKEGDILEHDPSFSTNVEAFALLTSYYAPEYMEWEKLTFIETYKTWNAATVQAEILEIESFIEQAGKLSLTDACRAFNKWGTDTDAFIYLRLKSGFYESLEIEKYPFIGSLGNKEAHIYGRYFLFYDFLKAKINALMPTPTETLTANATKPFVVKNKGKTKADKGTVGNNKKVLADLQNNFDKAEIKDVYSHFKQGLVDKKHLTEDELLRYLKAAFEDKKVPSRLFQFSGAPKKEKIMQVFYKYYTDVAGKLHGTQVLYAALLGDYFTGYNTKTVSSNFSKSGY